jgi:hypothetical protein
MSTIAEIYKEPVYNLRLVNSWCRNYCLLLQYQKRLPFYRQRCISKYTLCFV